MTLNKINLPFNINNKHILIIFFCIFIITFSIKSYAAYCTGVVSGNSFNIQNITFNRDTPINTKISSDIASNIATTFNCVSSTRSTNQYGLKITSGNLIGTISGRSIYSTNINGIGFAAGMQITSPTSCGSSIFWVDGTNTGDGNTRNRLGCTLLNDTSTIITARYYIAFYKTSALASSGTVNINQSVHGISYANGIWETTEATVQANSFTSSAITCTVSTASPISLQPISANALSQVNSPAGVSNFSITVNCPAQTDLAITFTDNNNKTQTGNTLTPDASSTAKGVAIQLQYLNSVIAFGPDSGVRGNTNQILLNSNLTGAQSFPFSAYYIRTGAVTPGSLSSSVTFTMSYL